MRCWHQDLIPKLCRQHLLGMWRECNGMYKIITENKKFVLSSGELCLISSQDENLLKWTWRTLPNGYVVRSNNNKKYYLHREITRCPKGMLVDHKNGNKLDNRRENLRICNYSQNGANQPKIKGSSEYKGVNWDKTRNKWLSCVRYKNKTYNLGRFKNEKDAAIAYDNKAKKLWGEFACLNFAKRPNSYINHPAVKEFENNTARLYYRLCLVQTEMIKRGYHPKTIGEKNHIWNKNYTPWQSLAEQIKILKAKECDCKV